MSNSLIKENAKKNGVFLWQIADVLGLSDANFSRKLRKELPSDEKDHILKIINDISNSSQK